MYKPIEFAPIIYKSWGEIIKTLSAEQRSELLLAFSLYPDYTPQNLALWGFFKNEINKQYQHFLSRSEKARLAGKQRAEKEKQSITSDSGRYLSTTVGSHKPINININNKKEIKEETYKEEKKEKPSLSASADVPVFSLTGKAEEKEKHFAQEDFPRIVEIYHRSTKNVFPKIRVESTERIKKAQKFSRQFFKDCGLKDKESFFCELEKYFVSATRIGFLRGEGGRGWRASFDYLISPKGYRNIIEGVFTPDEPTMKAEKAHDWRKEQQQHLAQLGTTSSGADGLDHGEAIQKFLKEQMK